MPRGDTLYLDTETYSATPIKNGHHAYFDSPSAQIMIATWAWDDEPVVIEDLTRVRQDVVTVTPPSDDLADAIESAHEIVIQNSAFDRTGIRKLWGVDIEIERVHDTMVRAMAHSLPGSLGKLGEIMGIDVADAKDDAGKDYINLFCKPRPKNMKMRRAHKLSHPKEWKGFLNYAGQDITAMRSLRAKLPLWNYRNTNDGHRELDLWRLDQRINDRGFAVDLDLAHKALSTIEREQKRLNAATKLMTKGDVEKASQRDAMLNHIFVEYGLYLPDMKKDTLERRLNDDELPDALKQLLRVRLDTSTTSTAKYKQVLRSVAKDGALHGTTAFCGALRTGRWAGRLFQPQNLPRPDMEHHEIEAAIEALQADALDLVTNEVMRSLSNILRGLIVARPGKKLVAADLEQIESRAAAWLSGEQWKLDKIAEYDTGEGFDNYVWAYAKAFNVTPEAVIEDKKRNGFWRQVGKVMELAQSYEGGVGAWLAFAMVYRLKLDQLAEEAYPNLPYKAREQAEIIWDWRKKKALTDFGLSKRTFVVIEAFKNLWREAHPATTSYWPELDKAAKKAVNNPGMEIEARKLVFQQKGSWLRMVLPSGRLLCYPSPQIRTVGGKDQLTYMGVNQYSRQWSRLSTYGGKLFENATQAVARDVMAHAMPQIEAEGYEILLTVHDEVICEAPDKPVYTSARLCKILSTNPPWFAGCPLAAGGFEAHRYRKD